MTADLAMPSTRWLVDNCPCGRCVHPITLERTVTLIDALEARARSVHKSADGSLTVDWGEGHGGVFSPALLATRSDLTLPRTAMWPIPRLDHATLDTVDGARLWLTALLTN